MATISTAIQLNDAMSAPIQSITNAMNMMLSAWEDADAKMSSGMDVGDVESIRSELDRATRSLDQMGDEQKEFNNEVDNGSDALSGMASKIVGMLGAFASLSAIKNTLGSAIEFASDLTEVQNVVDVSFGESTEIINEWSKTTLDAFGLNELSAKKFAGTMGAMLKSSGLTGEAVTEMSMKITELAGDMASFYNLEGQEAFDKLRSGISGETEPLKALGINMSVANLEAYALSQGIDKAFNEMSQGEQVMLRYSYLLQATADAQGDFARTSDSFSNQQKLLSENWKSFTGDIVSGLLPTLSALFSMLNNGISWLSENWSVLQPIILGVAAAMGVYAIAAGICGITSAIHSFQLKVHAASLMMDQGATFAATAAQYGFNAALMACPVTWIIVAIIAVIALIYMIVAAINKLQGTTLSATGIIVGVLAVAGAFILNLAIGVINAIIQAVWSIFVEPFMGIIEWVLNAANGGFNSFGGAVANLIGQIISWFLSLGKVVTKIIDAIFGTDWTGGLSALQDSVVSWGKTDDAITIEREAPQITKRFEYGNAWDAGYDFGANLTTNFTEMLGGLGSGDDFGSGIPSDLTNGNRSLDDLMGMVDGVGDIADSTGDIKDSLDVTNENLKYMRSLAEQDAINRFTTAEIRVEMGGVNNTVNNTTDLDGVIDYMVTGVQEAMERVAEGVHD